MDESLNALADVHRRTLLVALLDHNPQDVSPTVASNSDETADTVEDLVRMEHCHLPKLEEYGFIQWNRDEDEVSKGPKFDEIRPLLVLLDEHEDELPPGWL